MRCLTMIEKEIVSGLLFKPNKIKTLNVEPKWFARKELREIVDTMQKLKEPNLTMGELLEEIQALYPLTSNTLDTLDNLRSEGIGKDLESLEDRLHKRYLSDQVARASADYAAYPDPKNFEKLQLAMDKKMEAETTENDGTLDRAFEDLFYKLENDVEQGIRTYPRIDDTLGGGMRGGMLITIGARTGVGKTAYGINLAIQALTKQKDMRMDFYTLEMSQGQMLDRFISRLSEINSYKLRNPNKTLTDNEKDLIKAKSQELLNSHLRIYDTKFNLRDIEIEIRRRHSEARGKPYIAFIDYLQLIEVNTSSDQRHLIVGEITRRLKLLTNELDIPIIVFAQLSRGIESRQDKTPVLADLRESGSIEQDSNVVMFLHQDEETDETIVSVAKNREGFTGDIRYRFLKTKMYFHELDEF